MPVIIVVAPPDDFEIKNALRADLAWKLFLPDFIGDLPGINKGNTMQMRHWLWTGLSGKLGFLKKEEETVYIVAPTLTDEGRDFLIRTCSLWTNEVFLIGKGNVNFDLDSKGENLWTAPVVNLLRDYQEGTSLARLTENHEDGIHTYFWPLLGAGRSFPRVYSLNPGGTYSRFHSHTAREELYLVLKGEGTIRIEKHDCHVIEGDLIAKPTGPDISTQFLADKGKEMKILDIEIFPDNERRSKDAVFYPDHGELDLFGEGWDLTIPADAIMSSRDAMENYDTGYRRKVDGTWEPSDIRGFKKREKK